MLGLACKKGEKVPGLEKEIVFLDVFFTLISDSTPQLQ